MKKNFLIALLLLAGCKSAEDIQRQQMVDEMNLQLLNNQKILSDLTQRMMQLEERLGTVTGQVEESTHHNRELVQKNINQLKEEVVILQEDLKSKEKLISSQQGQLQQQGKFIKKLTNTLQSAKDKKNPYTYAMDLYKKGSYAKARPILVELSDDKSLSKTQHARILHNIGLIDYMAKKYQDATVSLSKVYTQYSKTGYVKNALLYLGKSFQKLNKKEDAHDAWKELIRLYPKSSQAKSAKKLMK